MDTKKMRVCAPMLPAPGDSVVIECLDEIERLQFELVAVREVNDSLKRQQAEEAARLLDAVRAAAGGNYDERLEAERDSFKAEAERLRGAADREYLADIGRAEAIIHELRKDLTEARAAGRYVMRERDEAKDEAERLRGELLVPWCDRDPQEEEQGCAAMAEIERLGAENSRLLFRATSAKAEVEEVRRARDSWKAMAKKYADKIDALFANKEPTG